MGLIIGLLCSVDVRRKQWQGSVGEVPRQKKNLCRVVSGPGTSCGNTSEASTLVAGWRKSFSIIDWKYYGSYGF
jgi:hypothetical protein